MGKKIANSIASKGLISEINQLIQINIKKKTQSKNGEVPLWHNGISGVSAD